MLKISSVIDSALIKDPWEHKVIDNVFDKQDFDTLVEAANVLSAAAIDGDSIRAWLPIVKDFGVSQAAVDVVIKGGNKILANFPDIVKDFYTGQRPKGVFFSMPKFEISGRNYEYKVHKDSFDKLLTFVIYIYPETHLGTRLYKTEDPSSYLESIEWQQNRAFMISPEADKNGWHNWKNDLNYPRVTLNYTVRSINDLTTYFENFQEESSSYCKLWLLDQFGIENLFKEVA